MLSNGAVLQSKARGGETASVLAFCGLLSDCVSLANSGLGGLSRVCGGVGGETCHLTEILRVHLVFQAVS